MLGAQAQCLPALQMALAIADLHHRVYQEGPVLIGTELTSLALI